MASPRAPEPLAALAGQLGLPPNPYARAPLHVTEYDCEAREPVRSAVLLGSVPAGVLAAAAGARPAPGARGPPDWPPKCATALEAFYGPGWKRLLTPDDRYLLPAPAGGAEAPGDDPGLEFAPPPAGEPAGEPAGPAYEGGAREGVDFGDLSSLNRGFGEAPAGADTPQALDEDDAVVITDADLAGQARRPRAPPEAGAAAPLARRGAPTVYSPLGAHGIDTIADLRKKVHLALGIPPHRQHLFWADAAPGAPPLGAYRITVGGVPVPVDARRFGERDSVHIAGLPVDKDLALEYERGSVFVEGRDNFTLLRRAAGGERLRAVFVVDLERVAGPRRRALAAAAADALHADFLYRGLVLKYWPLLSFAAFADYLRRPDELAALYPRLVYGPRAATRRALEDQERAQERLLFDMESRADAVLRRYAAAGAVAVSSATAVVNPRRVVAGRLDSGLILNVRNLFDLLATAADRPAVVARFYMTAAGGRQDLEVVKKHVTAELGGNDDAADIARVCGRAMRRNSVAVVLRDGAAPAAPGAPLTGLVGGAWLRGRARLIVLTVRDDGYYSAEAGWPEDRRMSPADVVAALAQAVGPVVAEINAMGALVFPAGGALRGLAGAGAQVSVESMSASFFWRQALSDAGFRELKRRWREYEAADLVAVRGLQQAGAFAFQFAKGVVDFDPRAIERTVVVTTATDAAGRQRVVREITDRTQSTYGHLTDDAIAQRWDCIYGGRGVRIHHRTDDVRVDLAGSNDQELRIVWGAVFAFFDGLARGPGRLAPALLRRAPGAGRGGLRALQDSDPYLFDLRRFDRNATVYSVLCQNPRPPVAYAPDEYRALPEKQRRRMTRYWNFTHGRPAYYDCADPRFPHLSFLEGRHPEGPCLPCCQMTPAHAGSRRDQINVRCMQDHPGADGADAAPEAGEPGAAATRHTLAYGKRVPPGRAATLARALEEGLFFETLEAGAEYRLLGASQSLAALPEAGLFFAVAGAVGAEPDALAQRMADGVRAMGEGHAALARGRAGALFESAGALAEAILATFAGGPEAAVQFTEFSPGGAAHECWKELVAELAGVLFGVQAVFFVDADGSARDVTVVFPPGARARLPHPGARLALLFDVGQAEGKRAGGGVYPLVRVRRGEEPRGVWGPEDAVVDVLREMAARSAAGPPAWDAGALAAALGDGPGSLRRAYSLAARLVGTRGSCYAALLAGPLGPVHVPVVHSPAPAAGGPGEGPGQAPAAGRPLRLADLGSAAATGELVGCLRRWGAANRMQFAPECLLRHGGEYFGVQVAAAEARLNFYHRPGRAPAVARGGLPGARGWPALGPDVDYPRLPWELDAHMWAARGEPGAVPLPAEGRWEAYLQVLYRLFAAALGAHVGRQRDAATRGRLAAALGGRAPLAACQAVLAELAAARPTYTPELAAGDLAVLRAALPALRGARLAAALDGAAFEFDREELHRLQAGGAPAAALLAAIMGPLVRLAPEAEVRRAVAAAPGLEDLNLVAACPPEGGAPPCQGGRLLVPQEHYAGLLELLGAEASNPMLAGAFALAESGVVDEARFAARPGERLLVRL